MSDSEVDWESLVRDADPELDEDPVVYEFSGGRKFKNSDRDAFYE